MTIPSTTAFFRIRQGQTTPSLDANLYPAEVAVVTKALSANVATLTTEEPHGFTAGAVVFVEGIDQTFDGEWTIASVVPTQFTFARTAPDVSPTPCDGRAISGLNLTTPGTTVTFLMLPQYGGPAKVSVPPTVTDGLNGGVSYPWILADVNTPGIFRGIFQVVIPGVGTQTYPADEIRILIDPVITASPGVQVGPFSPYCTPDDVRDCTPGIDPETDLTQWIQAASELLYQKTGQQFTGLGTAQIRPAHKECSCGGRCGAHAWGWPLLGGFGGYTGYPYGAPGWGLNALGTWEGSQPIRSCASEITLPRNTRDVLSVRIDGTELDSATWRLDPGGHLIRQADPVTSQILVWPCCDRYWLPPGSVGTFDVTYTFGQDPPTLLIQATAELAGQFALACQGAQQCKLPPRTQNLTRQGVTAALITDISALLDKGYIGLATVDTVISTFNPYHLQRRARGINIDVPSHRLVTP